MEILKENDLNNLLILDNSSELLADKIIAEDDVDKVKQLTQLFNLNQAKKNVLRVLKFNSLLDKVSDQMLERFEKCPGEFSNKDLMDYLTVTQNAIDRANKSLNLVEETPAIQINQVNINTEQPKLSRESKDKIMKAVQAIMKKAENLNIQSEENTDIIEVDPTVIVEEKLNGEDDGTV